MEANQINYSRVLQILREEGSSNRAQLARQTGLSAASVTSITRDLLARGYIRATGSRMTQRGRPVEVLEYDASSRYALGLDIHNHAIYGVVTDLYARVLDSRRLAPVEDGVEAVLDGIVRSVNLLTPAYQEKECAGIGLALPGVVNPQTGELEYITEFNLPALAISDLLAESLPQRPYVTNRTYAEMLAESWCGVAQHSKNLIYLRIGEQVGGAILIGGLPFWGSNNSAGSIAHTTVDPRGITCRCGNRGCLDTVASGYAMARRVREEMRKGRMSTLSQRTNWNMESITGSMVLEEANAGDVLALEVVHEALGWFGIAAANCVNLLNVDMIVLGGNLGRRFNSEMVDVLYQAVRARAYPKPMSAVRIMTSALGDDAVASGAAATAIWASSTRSIQLHV
jgi:predicted NBD/HSP70 family sugar kinase